MEFEVIVNPQIGVIDFNLSELKQALAEEVEIYKGLVVSEDNIQASKRDLASLRKIRTQIDDRKKAVKKAFIEPYTKFENEVKEAFAILDEPINHIDKQVKEFEELRKEAKKNHCREVYSAAVGDMADFIPFERIFNEKWLNATSTDKDITDAVESEIIHVKNDLNAIHALGSEIESECVEAYKIAGTLTAAIQRNSDYLKAKSNVTEDKPSLGYVMFKVLAADADRVSDMLDFAEIKYERR